MATDVNRPQGRDEILDAVLDAAEKLFTTAGPFDVSLRAIAQAAGVNYGLVHRHFGTKDALFERLLQRYADRWGARLRELDYEGALDELLGADLETGAYVRLLAWTLLSDRESAQSHAHRRYATLDQLPTLAASAEPEVEIDVRMEATAAALAFAFGWRFFNPFIRDALHLESDSGDLQAAMRSYLHRLSAELPEAQAR
jgi:AcrR family transcriptional regulator